MKTCNARTCQTSRIWGATYRHQICSLFSIYFRPVTPVSLLHWSRSFCLFRSRKSDELNTRMDRGTSATLNAALSDCHTFYHVPM